MSFSQLLPWFPILLGVGVGGRLLGRARGLVLGGVCALFWIALIQALAGTRIWSAGWTVLTIVLGTISIVLMGAWSGQPVKSSERGNDSTLSSSHVSSESFFRPPSGIERRERRSTGADAVQDASQLVHLLERITGACRRFDVWINEHRDSSDLWPAFGEFVRDVLFQTCRGTHVKPYRMDSETGAWMPLRGVDEVVTYENQLPKCNLVEDVLGTHQSYVSPITGGDRDSWQASSQDRQSPESIAWCFAIRSNEACLGLITVGRLDANPSPPRALLDSIEQIVGQFWRTVAEASTNRSAEKQDAASGLLHRSSFIQQAEIALQESQNQGEPAAVAMIAIHGLRELNDGGKWEIADELIQEVGRALREKVRHDDRFGRFDGSRFVWLLRRVDSELASLIVRQVMTRLAALCGERQRWHASIAVRCGLVGGDLEASDIRTLVSKALVQSRRARTENINVATDFHKAREPALAGNIE